MSHTRLISTGITKQVKSDGGFHQKSEKVITGNIEFFHAGNPYAKDQKESRSKGKCRKFLTKLGWLSIDEISEKTGFNRSKINRLLRHKTIEQIMEAN